MEQEGTHTGMDFLADLEAQLSASLEDCCSVLDHPDMTASEALCVPKSFMTASLTHLTHLYRISDASMTASLSAPIGKDSGADKVAFLKEAGTIKGLKRLNAHAVATMLHGGDLEGMIIKPSRQTAKPQQQQLLLSQQPQQQYPYFTPVLLYI
jgi:hypothetical protein